MAIDWSYYLWKPPRFSVFLSSPTWPLALQELHINELNVSPVAGLPGTLRRLRIDHFPAAWLGAAPFAFPSLTHLVVRCLYYPYPPFLNNLPDAMPHLEALVMEKVVHRCDTLQYSNFVTKCHRLAYLDMASICKRSTRTNDVVPGPRVPWPEDRAPLKIVCRSDSQH